MSWIKISKWSLAGLCITAFALFSGGAFSASSSVEKIRVVSGDFTIDVPVSDQGQFRYSGSEHSLGLAISGNVEPSGDGNLVTILLIVEEGPKNKYQEIRTSVLLSPNESIVLAQSDERSITLEVI